MWENKTIGFINTKIGIASCEKNGTTVMFTQLVY